MRWGAPTRLQLLDSTSIDPLALGSVLLARRASGLVPGWQADSAAGLTDRPEAEGPAEMTIRQWGPCLPSLLLCPSLSPPLFK